MLSIKKIAWLDSQEKQLQKFKPLKMSKQFTKASKSASIYSAIHSEICNEIYRQNIHQPRQGRRQVVKMSKADAHTSHAGSSQYMFPWGLQRP